MIEEIKNWIDLQENEDFIEISGKTLYKILDKYKDKEIKFENGSSKYAIVKVPELKFQDIKNYNQPDYKSAFKKLKQEFGFETVENMNGKKDCLGNFMQELEQKYNLGGE